MGVHINDDSMSLEIGGATVNAAVRLDNLWRVTGWPRLLSRNEAITALTLAEWLLMSGRSADALCVAAWREELAKWATGSSGSPPLLPWPRSPPWRQSSPTGTPTNSSARTASPAWPLDSYLSLWTASSWRRACSCSTPVDGTSPDHHWRGGASVLASSPPSVPPWRTASVTGLSVP